MRYLYTDKPDDWCHEVNPGIYGRPVHTSQEKKLMADGWKVRIEDVQQTEESQKVPKAQEVDSTLEEARKLFQDVTGKKAHHKATAETLLKKVKAHQEKTDD